MAGDQLQLRGGTEAENDAFTGAAREVTVDTTNNRLRVHDGSTQGGHEITTTPLSDADPEPLGATADEGTSTEAARADHVHPAVAEDGMKIGGTAAENTFVFIEAGEFNPTFAFSSPGDLSVTYNERSGWFIDRIVGGIRIVEFGIWLDIAPTFTTSSGGTLIRGLPVAASAAPEGATGAVAFLPSGNIELPSGTTMFAAGVNPGLAQIRLFGRGDAAGAGLGPSEFTSGNTYSFRLTGAYRAGLPA